MPMYTLFGSAKSNALCRDSGCSCTLCLGVRRATPFAGVRGVHVHFVWECRGQRPLPGFGVSPKIPFTSFAAFGGKCKVDVREIK